MSAQLLEQFENNGDFASMCCIASSDNFSFETLFAFYNKHQEMKRPVSVAFQHFSLWLLDRIEENRTRDKGDYVLQIIAIATEHNDPHFFQSVIEHSVVGKSAWPMMAVCSRRRFEFIDLLFDIYPDDVLEHLSQFMLKSNLQPGVRERLSENMERKNAQRQAQHIGEQICDVGHNASIARKI